MWSHAENHTPGQGQSVQSANASQAAHKGAVKAKATAALSAHAGQAPVAPPARAANPGAGMSYKSHIAMAGAQAGVPLNTDDIHQTIGGLTQAGVFTPQQGMALVQHNGPLQGAAGAQTMHTITKAAINRKTRPQGPPPGAAPGGPPGAPRPPMPAPGGMTPPRPPGGM